MDSIKLNLVFVFLNLVIFAVRCCDNCGIGNCIDGKCVCPNGFWGSKCQFGRQRMTNSSGYISESKNLYIAGSKISWLIDSQRRNSSIKLQIESFASECAWDYLYIYDGRSIYDPLIAAFSGTVDMVNSTKRQINARSGAALVHFYSDKLLGEQGFNLSYRISDCRNQWCSDKGFCNSSGLCECKQGWSGKNCSVKICCPEETYDIGKKIYNCPKNEFDSNCPIKVAPRASHASALQNTDIWIYGGYNYEAGPVKDLVKYDTVKKSWQVVSANPEPKPRSGHSMVYYNKKLFIYGGMINGLTSRELWEFDIPTKTWKRVSSPSGKQPIGVTGHAAVAVANKMYVFMGYNVEQSFYSGVQQFDMDTYEWSIVAAKGALILGSFGHSAVYDVISDVIFVYGGYPAITSGQKKRVSDMLYTFSPTTKSWSVMPKSNQPRMLHSAVILGRLVVIYGGTIHAHSTTDTKKQCYSRDVLAYDIACKTWSCVNAGSLLKSKGRFGHTAISKNRTAYVFGGFDGVFQSDVIPITIGHCAGYTTKAACLQAPFVVNCVWDKVLVRCLDAEKTSVLPSSQIETQPCNATAIKCQSFGSCKNCLSNTASCSWCHSSCQDPTCNNDSKLIPVKDSNLCPASQSLVQTCKSFPSCTVCESHPNCSWTLGAQGHACSYQALKSSHNVSERCHLHNPSKAQCYKIDSCSECTKSLAIGCMWCQSQKRCIELHAYFVNFAYGQCMELTTDLTCPKLTCSQQKTCKNCFELPGCGWCEDPLRTGIGKCMDGGDLGPSSNNNSMTCPASRWHFMQCPSCDCNGHSQCVNQSICEHCSNNTAGPHCQLCKPLYYGDPLNNGTCKACFCNSHGLSCNVNGKCECDTTGVVGDHCGSCDLNGYHGNASKGGHCFYTLPVGFSYTFNRTNKKINFDATPNNDRDDMHFEVTVGDGHRARMDFSITQDGSENFITKKYLLGSYGRVFIAEKYKFVARKEPVFRVYLYDWSKNAGFTISFHQKAVPLNWLHFLIVFLICFCSLLIILIVIWKLKQQYSNYQFNRRRRDELREMASRPCGHVSICCDNPAKRSRKVEPSQIALESFQRCNAAVVSILVELPRTGEGFPPKGQSGICIGSTIVAHKNQRIILNAQQQLCIFRERRKNYRQTPVNV